jgi:hypothetical protein
VLQEAAAALVGSSKERCQAPKARRYPRVALILDKGQQLDQRLADAATSRLQDQVDMACPATRSPLRRHGRSRTADRSSRCSAAMTAGCNSLSTLMSNILRLSSTRDPHLHAGRQDAHKGETVGSEPLFPHDTKQLERVVGLSIYASRGL